MKVSGNNTPGPSEETSSSDMTAITESAISTTSQTEKTWRQKNPTFLQEIEWTDKSSRANRADDKFSGQANDQSEQNITVHSSTQNRNLLEYYLPPLSARLVVQYHFKGWNSRAFAQ
ncbi:hypothetical protein V1478_008231 [Vespula squamosa]|uniref:Uncharacterized protein n=1 Tax=Vespula squamosa TaxID=30214 RepID=A0ABD2AY83_VESSQ